VHIKYISLLVQYFIFQYNFLVDLLKNKGMKKKIKKNHLFMLGKSREHPNKNQQKRKKENCGFVVDWAEAEAAMERGRVGGGKNVQASPDLVASCPPPTPLQASSDLELGALEPREKRRKSRSQEVEEIAGQRYKYQATFSEIF
jgi:hypothetical protein